MVLYCSLWHCKHFGTGVYPSLSLTDGNNHYDPGGCSFVQLVKAVLVPPRNTHCTFGVSGVSATRAVDATMDSWFCGLEWDFRLQGPIEWVVE